MGNPVVHWELWSDDPAKLSNFYEGAFGWKIQHVPDLAYWMAETGGAGGINGGLFRPDGSPDSWPAKVALYIQVPDLAAALEKVKAGGGKVLVERKEIPGMGALALFMDPDDRVVGLWWMPS